VAAASGIAGSNFMQTGWTAMRLGFIKYIVPFFFVYNSALLTYGALKEIVVATSFAVIGIFFLSSALEGYLWGVGRLKLSSRFFLIAGGILTAFPEWISSLVGLLTLVITTVVSYVPVWAKRKALKVRNE